MRFKAVAALATFLCLCAPGIATARPLQLDFVGNWGFFDPQQDQPEFWSALNRLGVYNGTPLTFSIVLDDIDDNPDLRFGVYRLLSARARVAGVEMIGSPGILTVSADGLRTLGSSMVGTSFDAWSPSFMQILTFGGVYQGDPNEDVLPNINNWRHALYMSYRSNTCWDCAGTASLRMVAAHPIPEAKTSVLILTGLLLFPVFRGLFITRTRRLALRRPDSGTF
jgi:hypothetical protein